PRGGEPVRFAFPRQDRHQRLCLSDYLRRSDDREDVVALQIVTVGREATEHIDRLQAAGEYSEAYFAHGLAVAAAEGLAELGPRGPGRSASCQYGRGRKRRPLRTDAQIAIRAMPSSTSPASSTISVMEVPSPAFAAACCTGFTGATGV